MFISEIRSSWGGGAISRKFENSKNYISYRYLIDFFYIFLLLIEDPDGHLYFVTLGDLTSSQSQMPQVRWQDGESHPALKEMAFSSRLSSEPPRKPYEIETLFSIPTKVK